MQDGIKDVLKKNDNEVVSITCLVQNAKENSTSNSSSTYVIFNCVDKTSRILAKKWDSQLEMIPEITSGEPLVVTGKIDTYKGTKQLIVSAICLATEGEYDINDLQRCAPFTSDEMMKSIYQMINGFQNENIKSICTVAFDNFKEKLKVWPAGIIIHHAYDGGLLYHLLQMARQAESIASNYPVAINKDLLVGGALLHDIGKVAELEPNESGGYDYSKSGKLLGHSYIGASLVKQLATKLSIGASEETLVLEHMLLSHHGTSEMGASVTPQTVEAQILHQLDMLDSRIDIFNTCYNNIEKGEFGTACGLECRSPYFPNLIVKDSDE